MANWTNAQKRAIETKDKTLLISAAAGSGKTTVLIERIIRALTDSEHPADISRMLIVTFTRAAAAELRQRISLALSSAIAERPSDKRLFRQLTALGSAHISTIDSFYSDVVRKNAQKLDIPSSLRIADDTELIPLRRKIMDRVISLGYSGELDIPADDFAAVCETLSDMRNDSALRDVFIDLFQKLESHPRSVEFLKEAAEMHADAVHGDFFDSPSGRVIRDYILSQLEYITEIMSAVCDFFSIGAFSDMTYLPPFANDLNFCHNAINALKNSGYETVRALFDAYAPQKRKALKAEDKTPEAEEHIKLRDLVKDKLTKLKAAYFSQSYTNAELKFFTAETAHRTRVLYSAISCFERLYSEEKLSRNMCEFSDVKLWAYRLLVTENGEPTDLAKDIASGFDAVYIDEYQDVDVIQDLIFRSISRPRVRFMVGDVKQSIYGFRGAEPSLFMSYRNIFTPIEECSDSNDTDECTIFMSDNFRCDKNVISFANRVCSYVFRLGSREIDYAPQDDLRFSKPVADGYLGTPVKVALINRKAETEDELGEDREYEAEYIAAEIHRLINEETKADGSRIEPSDIAVLYRSSTFGAKMASVLDRYGISHTFGSSESIFDSPDVLMTLSLLHAIDNPLRDIHLAALLISPIFGFTAQMLVDIRELSPENANIPLYDALCNYSAEREDELSQKCKSFISELDELRSLSQSMPADKIIRFVFSKYSLLSRSVDGKNSKRALLTFYENARSYEGDTFKGLYSYLKYVDEMRESGKTVCVESPELSTAVKLMTMHKSKGLEFPVCFVSGCASSFNRDDAKDYLLYSPTLGIAMDLGDQSGFGRIKTPMRQAISREIYEKSSEEEMRILYVALTRARERLYVTAAPRYGTDRELTAASVRSRFGTRASIMEVNNYISWVLSAISGVCADDFDMTVISPVDIPTPPEVPKKNVESVSKDTDSLSNAEKYHEAFKSISEIFSYQYPYLHVSKVPAKLSVSKLSPDVLDRNEDSAADDAFGTTLDTHLPKAIVSPFFTEGEAKPSAAERGTDTHTFLQFCDFEKVSEHGSKKELLRLIDEGFLPPRTSDTVDLKQIDAFFSSELFGMIGRARRIFRERRFNIMLPAKSFTEDSTFAKELGSEPLLVQGVIDIVLETDDGRLILCDYKTDYLTREQLNDKELARKKLEGAHRRQLSYYAEAVEKLFGRYPDEILIYSLPLGDHIKIVTEKMKE